MSKPRWEFSSNLRLRRVLDAALCLPLASLLALAPCQVAAAATAERAWSCPGGPYPDPIPADARLTRLANALPSDDFNQNGTLNANVEGALWLGKALFVSEFGLGANPPPSRILKITGNTPGVVFTAQAGTNGLAADSAGRLHGASHAMGGIVRFSGTGDVQTLVVGRYRGARFNSPNDLAFRSDGTLYFTDPTWQAPTPAPQAQTRVYRVAPGARSATVVDEARSQPNGITLSPDEKTLYVSALDGLFHYAVAADGSTGPAQRFARQIANGDGMVVDCAGHLYVTSGDVIALNTNGREVGRLALPPGGGSVTNLAFGGVDHQTLYVTVMGAGNVRGVYRARLAVPGLPY